MSFTKQTLTKLVFDRAEENGIIVNKDWLVQGVTLDMSHSGESESDVYCRFFTVTKAAEEYFRKKPSLEEAEQMNLPGYDYIQRKYAIQLEGETVAMPVEMLTDNIINEQVIPRLERIMVGCQYHIEELKRYMDARKNEHVA